MCYFYADAFRTCSNRLASEMKQAHSFYQSTLVTTVRNYFAPLKWFCWCKQIFWKLFISWWHATVSLRSYFNLIYTNVVCHINTIKPVHSDVLLYNLKIGFMWQDLNSLQHLNKLPRYYYEPTMTFCCEPQTSWYNFCKREH